MRAFHKIKPLFRTLPFVLSAALATACAANIRSQASGTIAKPAAPALTPSNYPKFKNFNSAGEAVAELIRVFDPDMIGFGEFHNELGGEFKSPSQRFGEEIVPILRDNGFNNLIIEFAPDSNQAAVELTRLRLSGKLDARTMPTLYEWSIGSDEKGILSIYRKAARMNIYGVNIESFEYVIIKKNVVRAANTILIDGKVVSYTGIYHNDINPAPVHREISFGPHFSRRCSYLEIDLIVPEMMGGYPMGDKEIKLYRPLVPSSGVMLYRESERKFVMIFAGAN